MKFPPTPILALLALGGACSLEPPSHSRRGGNAGATTPDSVGIGGSDGEGGSSSTITASGGNTAQRDAGVTGGNSANGGASTPTSTGSTFSGGGTPTGGSTSGGTATGGARGGATGGSATGGTRGGSTATGGSSTGGTMTGGFTSGGSRTGGTTATGGSTATGGTSARGGATGGTSTGGSSTSPSGTHAQPPPITNGSSGYATRYWDCCKPSCGWSANANGKPTHTCGKDGTSTVGNDTQSACGGGGGGYMCYWGAPWSVSDTLSYGFAAYNNVPCGTCFQIQFTGKGQYNDKDPGSMALNGKTMIVQVINIGGIAANQFDLLIPGGGVGANNACTGGSAQWSGANIGDTNGGMLTSCKDSGSCVSQMCQSAFGNMPQLLAGCNWVAGWFAAADNPQMVYQKTTCPPEITAKSGM